MVMWKGRDEKGCLLSTEKKAAVAVDCRKVQPALFKWSTVDEKSAVVDVDGTFHDQVYNKKYYFKNFNHTFKVKCKNLLL